MAYSEFTDPHLSSLYRVLHQFPDVSHEITEISSATGGFSGANVFEVRTANGHYALRRWPLNSQTTFPVERIQELHRLQLHYFQVGLPVAVPLKTRKDAKSVLVDKNITWQCEPWLVGRPHDGLSLSDSQLRNVMHCLAKLHQTARSFECTEAGKPWFAHRRDACPTILERRRFITENTSRTISSYQNKLAQAPPRLRELMHEILKAYSDHATMVDTELKRLEQVQVELYPCWRDLWSAHVLFDGEQVSGLIDAAATRTDHTSTDLSRLLGSWFADDKARWQTALNFYAEIRSISGIDQQFMYVLDRSSVLLSGMSWIKRWCNNEVQNKQLPDIFSRLETNLQRLNQL